MREYGAEVNDVLEGACADDHNRAEIYMSLCTSNKFVDKAMHKHVPGRTKCIVFAQNDVSI
jgi:hypothetical protein